MSDTWDEVTLFPCFVHSVSERMLQLLSRVEAHVLDTILIIPDIENKLSKK